MNKNDKIYYVGAEREHKSLTKLFLELSVDESEKTIYIDAGTYDIFKEYKEVGLPSPPNDVSVGDYFKYNAFLPLTQSLSASGMCILNFARIPTR